MGNYVSSSAIILVLFILLIIILGAYIYGGVLNGLPRKYMSW